MKDRIILYGSSKCHKTLYYQSYLTERNLIFIFKDVVQNKEGEKELRNLYQSRGLNFPTLLINGKKLRNPNEKDLKKRLSSMAVNQ